MSYRFRIAGVTVLALVLCVGSWGCGGSGPEGYVGRGEVQAVDAEARKITIDHQDIPGLMKAMTMTFELAPDVGLEGVSVGSAVEFSVMEQGGVYTVTEVRATGG